MADEIEVVNTIKTLDKSNLYRVDVFTDTVVGDIRVLVPVKLETYLQDMDRALRFLASVTVAWGNQPVPVTFEIPASSLSEAIDKYTEVAQAKAAEWVEQMQSQMRQQAILSGGARIQ